MNMGWQMYLRRLQESDLKDRVMWMNDVAVYPSMGFTPPISLCRA